MKVALYARVSTDDKGQDPETQLLSLREFCEREGHLAPASSLTKPQLATSPGAKPGPS